MYCPQCGTDSSSGVQYCRACGANLKVIGKAVALSEAIARSDRGPLPRIREMVKGLTVDHVTEDVSHALERMNNEIAKISPNKKQERRHWINFRKHKTPEEKREEHISKGVVSLFSGVGLTVFLYYLSAAIILKLPADVISQIPFEIDPVIKIIWLFGLVPTLTGLGHIIAGLLIRPQRNKLLISDQPEEVDHIDFPVAKPPITSGSEAARGSITDHTTELLRERSLQ